MAVESIRSFGRTRSRTIKPNQAALLTEWLPRLSIKPDLSGLSAVAACFEETWLEIGFGGGEHLAAQAAAHPNVLVLGAEPYINGVASALRHLKAADLSNVRLWSADGRTLMAALPDASLARLFVLFPDPWPKRRQNKRRLVDASFVEAAARLLKPGGLARLATDWEAYADQVLDTFNRSSQFAWTARCARDWRRPPHDHVTTRYEQKGLGDIRPMWLEFQRLSPAPAPPLRLAGSGAD
jgi:tRNA (guanine-N7-)-methyltransferase